MTLTTRTCPNLSWYMSQENLPGSFKPFHTTQAMVKPFLFSWQVGRLLGCYGDLFTTSMDMGWGSAAAAAAAGEEEAARKPCCVLTVASNEITRVRADIDSLVFQSKLPPRITVRWVHKAGGGEKEQATLARSRVEKLPFCALFWNGVNSQIE